METPFPMPLRSCPLLAGLKPHDRDGNRGANGHRDGTVSSRQCSRVGINLSWLSSFDYIRTMELEQESWIWRNALAILLVKLVITESYSAHSRRRTESTVVVFIPHLPHPRSKAVLVANPSRAELPADLSNAASRV